MKLVSLYYTYTYTGECHKSSSDCGDATPSVDAYGSCCVTADGISTTGSFRSVSGVCTPCSSAGKCLLLLVIEQAGPLMVLCDALIQKLHLKILCSSLQFMNLLTCTHTHT